MALLSDEGNIRFVSYVLLTTVNPFKRPSKVCMIHYKFDLFLYYTCPLNLHLSRPDFD